MYAAKTIMERWLSWSKAHDWKSCVPYKGTEGSNPSLSAKKVIPPSGVTFFMNWNEGDSNEPAAETKFLPQKQSGGLFLGEG